MILMPVYANGIKKQIKINSDELVPGDVFDLPNEETLIMPCDALLITGTSILSSSFSVCKAAYGSGLLRKIPFLCSLSKLHKNRLFHVYYFSREEL